MTKLWKRLAVIATCAAFTTASLGVHAGTGQFAVIVQPVTQAIYDVAGNPVPMSAVGQVGDVFFSDRQVFAADTSTEPATVAGPAVGRSLIECRVIAATTMSAPPAVLCRASFTIEDRGFMTASGPVDLTAPQNAGAITGGAGDFAGTTGDFVASPLPGGKTLYRIRLLVPPRGNPVF
jgi:hypothetical protein